jgi:hypothetical protein
MSDKLKTAETVAQTVVDVVTGGAKATAAAPVVVETGADTVEVVLEVLDKAPLNKRIVIGAAVALGLAGLAGGVAFWAARRRNKAEVEEIVDEATHRVVDEMTKPTEK